MPAIQFDVLVPDSAAAQVGEAFETAVETLVRRGKLAAGSVEHAERPLVDASFAALLADTYRHDRGEDPDEAGAVVHRYIVRAEGAASYNQLAMGLSRILTPKAQLPRDPAALEREERFEQPSIYPWAVEILR
ncbi:hypothetical protein [Corynebacterium liangguodongii]|uniref:Uncharacterized protein n=1 Tax=Corynebacterium liangguodongii TaxID=2079535 RepID=A0A2S0WET8_9CORY|nr:hypothetical protein [Corynebacterium liangguodongii]AWB84276.1 hypothetical protein C3E79_07110 [Corynebacterium liangguodongii]PWC00285.1 hypothetical protein DF219_03745 [Corynebacterium liangguodongii]